MELRGNLKEVNIDWLNGRVIASFFIRGDATALHELKDTDLDIEVKKHRERRSLNANAYAWALINEIANRTNSSKDNVYLLMLKRYGQHELVSVLSDVNVKPYFKYYEVAGETTLQGKDFTHYRVFKGSSEYDTREMSILNDGIVLEAKELDIETMTPNDLERLKQAWRAS